MKQIDSNFDSKILGVVGIPVVVYLATIFVVLPWLSADLPELPDDMDRKDWEGDFTLCLSIGVGFSLLASVLWYGFAQWRFKINNPEDAKGKRKFWVLLFIISGIATIVAIVFFTMLVKSGDVRVYALFVFIGPLLCYYLPTRLFSPTRFKYIPWP